MGPVVAESALALSMWLPEADATPRLVIPKPSANQKHGSGFRGIVVVVPHTLPRLSPDTPVSLPGG